MNEVIVISPESLRSLIQGAVSTGVKKALEGLAKESQKIMDEDAAAEYLSVSSGTLRIWRSKGRGPKYRKIGRMIRYDKSDLDVWLNSHGVLTIDSLAG